MTLILSPLSFPILLSDLVITRDQVVSATEVSLPYFPEKLGFEHRGRQLVELRQKSAILTPDFAASWAGPFLLAQRALRRLKADSAQLKSSTDIQNAIIDELAGDAAEIALFAWKLTNRDPNNVVAFSYFWEGQSISAHGPAGSVMFAGSGLEHFRKLFGDIRRAVVARSMDDQMRAVSFLMSAAANASIRETLAKRTLENHYGGGFEIVVVKTGQTDLPHSQNCRRLQFFGDTIRKLQSHSLRSNFTLGTIYGLLLRTSLRRRALKKSDLAAMGYLSLLRRG
jgi:hypothetical protein